MNPKFLITSVLAFKACAGLKSTTWTRDGTTQTIEATTITDRHGTITVSGTTATFTPTTITNGPNAGYPWPANSNPGFNNPGYGYYWLRGNADSGYGICGALGSTLTSVDAATLSTLASDLSSYYAAYTSAHPMPTILTQAPSDLASIFSATPSLYASAWSHIAPYAASSDISALQSLVSSLNAPSSLSSELFAFVSARNSWLAPQYLAQASIASRDLGLQGTAPAWLSAVSTDVKAVAATGTAGAGAAGATTDLSTAGTSVEGSHAIRQRGDALMAAIVAVAAMVWMRM